MYADHTPGNALWRLQEALELWRPEGVSFDRWMAVTYRIALSLLYDYERLMRYRLWRPVSHPVSDWPLAVCDYKTIQPQDLHEVDTVLPHRVNEIYHLEYNPKQRWYYMSNQEPDEAILMKTTDSDPSCAKCGEPRDDFVGSGRITDDSHQQFLHTQRLM